jgi:Sec-independent protein secretion pathway component TatC
MQEMREHEAKMKERTDRWDREYLRRGGTPEGIHRRNERAATATVITSAVILLGGAYVAYKALRWAWWTFWVTDEDLAVAEWKETNDIRKY